ncbi:MAG TPA: hypothetical protein VGP19_03230 [Candidatus Acidoferrales bacterium]|jgi:hypothetical protein|nr:hypothetical protein [Candidatus Acidoferrales bacterium]
MSKSNQSEPGKKLVQRREFLGGAATMAGASFLGRGAESTWRDFWLRRRPVRRPHPK